MPRNEALIFRLARIESRDRSGRQAPKARLRLPPKGASFAIPLEGLIDIAEEKARLSKTLEKLEKDMGGLRGRLEQPQFRGIAPPEEVVDETREKLALGEEEIAKIQAALLRPGGNRLNPFFCFQISSGGAVWRIAKPLWGADSPPPALEHLRAPVDQSPASRQSICHKPMSKYVFHPP